MDRELSIWKMMGARHRRYAIALMACTFLVFISVSGASCSETRQHGAHVHGVGKLNIALDGNDLMLELRSPAANIVGFEHPPENEQQNHKVHKAIELLEAGNRLFVLTTKAQCSLHEAHVDNDMVQEGHEEHEAHHQEHEDAHSDKEHEHADGSVHSEFTATYHFECSNPESLRDIDVQLLSLFPGFEELEVQLLTPKKQTAAELTPEKTRISLK